jgi:hypothetical protein
MTDYRVSLQVEGPPKEDERGIERRDTTSRVDVRVTAEVATEIIQAVYVILGKTAVA